MNKDKRINITDTGYTKRAKTNILLLLLIGGLCSYGLVHFSNKSSALLVSAMAIAVCTILISFYLYRHIHSASIKGGFLLMKSINNKSKVTSLRSINKIKTISALGILITSITYNLDGKNQSSLIINSHKTDGKKPDEAVNEALTAYQEVKKKANHKPGPVAV